MIHDSDLAKASVPQIDYDTSSEEGDVTPLSYITAVMFA